MEKLYSVLLRNSMLFLEWYFCEGFLKVNLIVCNMSCFWGLVFNI